MDLAVGLKILGECEAATLEEILAELAPKPKTKAVTTHISGLDSLISRHFRETSSAVVALRSRPLPLIYRLLATLVSAPHQQTVLVIDPSRIFDATSIPVSASDLEHVHVLRPTPSRGPEYIDRVRSACEWMLYGKHASRQRCWWGVVVLGSLEGLLWLAGERVLVGMSWRGWLTVERCQPERLGQVGITEALQERDERQKAMDAMGWVVVSQWGEFTISNDCQD